MRADDALKYAFAVVRDRVEWTTDEIGGSSCDHHGHELQCDAMFNLIEEIGSLAGQFGDTNLYSDGRVVRSVRWIEKDALSTGHVWHPDPSQERPQSWRGHLLSDPGVPSPGIYEVSTDPATQEIHVRVVRTA